MAGPYRDEIEKLEALYAENPAGRVFTHLAEAYRRAGEAGRAREVLEEGLRRHPDYSSAHVVLGRVLQDLGDASGAESAFQRVVELDPHNLVALRALGDLARRDGRRDVALGYYRELLALDPSAEDVETYVETGEMPGPSGAVAATAPTAAARGDEPHEHAAAPDEGSAPAEEAAAADEDRVPAEEAAAADEGIAPAGEGAAASAEGAAALAEGAASSVEGGRSGDEWDRVLASTPEPESSDVEPASAESEEGEAGAGADAGEEDVVEAEAGGEAVGEETQAVEVEEGVFEEAAFGEVVLDEVVLEVFDEGGASRNEETDAGTFAAGTTGEEEGRVTAFGEEALDDLVGSGRPEDEEDVDLVIESVVSELGLSADAAGTEGEAAGPGEEDGADEDWLMPWEEEPGATASEAGAVPGGDSELVTETIGDLYVKQGLHGRAAEVYRELLRRRPDDEELEGKLRDAEAAAATVPDAYGAELRLDDVVAASPSSARVEDVESAWTGRGGAMESSTSPYAWPPEEGEEAEPAGPTIRDYFGSLLAWRAEGPLGSVEVGGGRATDEPAAEGADAGTAERPGVGGGTAAPEAPADASPRAAGGGEGAAEGGSGGEGEDDEDLDVFRAWLQSLKR